jgi:hypothetical protein
MIILASLFFILGVVAAISSKVKQQKEDDLRKSEVSESERTEN